MCCSSLRYCVGRFRINASIQLSALTRSLTTALALHHVNVANVPNANHCECTEHTGKIAAAVIVVVVAVGLNVVLVLGGSAYEFMFYPHFLCSTLFCAG